jgi:hypothetical protein
MLKRWVVLLLVMALGVPHAGLAADVDTDLATGVRQAQEGDFENAVTTLDSVVRRLTGQPGRAKDLARAYTYLSIAYLGLSQEQTAKAKFMEAWKAEPGMELSPREFPPRILEFFEEARREAGVSAPPAPATPAPAPRPVATPEPEEKKGGSKTVPILIGVAVLGGVGAALAMGGGGDDGGNGGGGGGNQPTGPLTFRLTWASTDDLDLHVIDPSGFEIYFAAMNSPSGGRLDQDVVCVPGTETVTWGSNAPRGTYIFWANYSSACSASRNASFTITVSQGNSVVATRSGTFFEGSESQRFSIVN